MSTVGLTKAMRRAMTEGFLSHGAMERKLLQLGLMEFHAASDGIRAFKLTPRGHAALAAPRMTQAELELMEYIEKYSVLPHRAKNRVVQRLEFDYGWIESRRGVYSIADPAGRTALNNVRAAMGSPEYKEKP